MLQRTSALGFVGCPRKYPASLIDLGSVRHQESLDGVQLRGSDRMIARKVIEDAPEAAVVVSFLVWFAARFTHASNVRTGGPDILSTSWSHE
jgi:hypothetical protein